MGREDGNGNRREELCSPGSSRGLPGTGLDRGLHVDMNCGSRTSHWGVGGPRWGQEGSRSHQSSALRSAWGLRRQAELGFAFPEVPSGPLTFSFSMREGMKLRLSAGRFVTGWIMTSWVKKSTAGWGDTDPGGNGCWAGPARPGASQSSEEARRLWRHPTS